MQTITINKIERVTVQTLADKLGVSRSRVYQILYLGALPGSEKIGDVWYIPAELAQKYKPNRRGNPGGKRNGHD